MKGANETKLVHCVLSWRLAGGRRKRQRQRQSVSVTVSLSVRPADRAPEAQSGGRATAADWRTFRERRQKMSGS